MKKQSDCDKQQNTKKNDTKKTSNKPSETADTRNKTTHHGQCIFRKTRLHETNHEYSPTQGS